MQCVSLFSVEVPDFLFVRLYVVTYAVFWSLFIMAEILCEFVNVFAADCMCLEGMPDVM